MLVNKLSVEFAGMRTMRCTRETATTTTAIVSAWSSLAVVARAVSGAEGAAETGVAVPGDHRRGVRSSGFSLQVRDLRGDGLFLRKRFVVGLPPSGSWQDLKDHMREAGDVCFADAFKDGSGVVEFLRYEDMKYAIKKLDDSRFRSHEVSCFC